jgi:chromosome segregation ATPase
MIDGDLLRQCGPEGEQAYLDLLAFESRANQLIANYKQQRIAILEPEHEQLIVERRQHGQRLDDLRSEEAKLNGHARSIDQRLRDARLTLKVLQDHPPLEPFSLKEEILQYDSQVAAAQKRVDAVLAEQFAHNAQVQGLAARADSANQKLVQLNQKTEDTWREIQKLRGLPVPRRRDNATGLPLP